jgi:hypothetical protein
MLRGMCVMLRNEASRPKAASTRFFACGLRMTPSFGSQDPGWHHHEKEYG